MFYLEDSREILRLNTNELSHSLTSACKRPQLETNAKGYTQSKHLLSVSAVVLAHFSGFSSELGKSVHLQHSLVSFPSHAVNSRSRPETLIPLSPHFTTIKPFSIWPVKHHNYRITSCKVYGSPTWILHAVNLISHRGHKGNSCDMYTLAGWQVSRCWVSSQSEVHISNLFLDSKHLCASVFPEGVHLCLSHTLCLQFSSVSTSLHAGGIQRIRKNKVKGDVTQICHEDWSGKEESEKEVIG